MPIGAGHLERSGGIRPHSLEAAVDRLKGLRSVWQEILPVERLREIALRLLRTHPLRSADSLWLAAAIAGSSDRPSTLPFLCADDRLILTAQKEGFPLPHRPPV